MDRKLKAFQYGVGKMSVYTLRYLIEKGAEVVGAVDVNPAVIGKDVGEVAGLGPLGVTVSDAKDVDAVLAATRPDVAVITTLSTMADVEDAFAACARNGVNAISTAEEALFPWNSSPAIVERLDALAKEHGVTLAGSGYPDMFWGTLIETVAGAMATITEIRGVSSYNVEDYGIALANGHGAGLTTEEFEAEIGKFNGLSAAEQQRLVEAGEKVPSYMWNQNGWLASKLGLTVVEQHEVCVPTTHATDLISSTLGMTVPAGQPTGMSAIVTTTTAEGITLITECIGKVYAPAEFDRNDWTFVGEPTTTVNVNRPATAELTCSTLVNRIPALIKAAPGFVSTDRLPNSVYLVRPINEYC